MNLIVLLACFISIRVQADVIQDDVTINGVRYEKEILYDNLDSPDRLAMDYQTNNLYFNYEKKGQDYSAKFNVNTKEFKEIEGTTPVIHGAGIDPNAHDVYMGGSDGIYKYNESTNKLHRVGTNGENSIIWNMYFKNILYFVALPSNYLYTFVNGQSARFADIPYEVDNFVIDNDDVMYFSYYSHFYRQKKGTNVRVEIKNVPYVTALNTDKNGNVYACTIAGFYKAIEHSAQFIKVDNNVYYCTGVAFDRDNNVIYSDNSKIIRLKPKGEYPLNV